MGRREGDGEGRRGGRELGAMGLGDRREGVAMGPLRPNPQSTNGQRTVNARSTYGQHTVNVRST